MRNERTVYVDDYAHHPAEITATLNSLRKLYPGKKLTGIFQPHLFSRTRDFADQFAQSLDLLDECILLEIYPAREKPIEGVSSEMLLKKMKCPDKKVLTKEKVLEEIGKHRPELLVTMGAGDIDALAAPLEKILNS